MLREKGIFSLKDVHYALLETSGSISVIQTVEPSAVTAGMFDIKPAQAGPTVMLIDERSIIEKGLKSIGKTKDWVMAELAKRNLQPDKIFYTEWSEQNGLYTEPYGS
ncbi:DUF421 domain-containing protein [Peribacillus glennii]|uniref:DUF421 domain-containing protein n=1 Tax=Peribacillus glennii TaxID=2303991 RepID=A0A372L6N8_9BACI|nr:DUF421 domain-containing protein [Peribacillus glennii]RFU60760.1 DUF421 domain-containing protein [Peribacillus glennii]